LKKKKVHPAAAAAERRSAPAANKAATATKGLAKSGKSGRQQQQQPPPGHSHARADYDSCTVDTSHGVVPVFPNSQTGSGIGGQQQQKGRGVSIAKGTVTNTKAKSSTRTKGKKVNMPPSNGGSADSPKQGNGGVSFRRLRRGGGPHVDAGAANAEYDERHQRASGTPRTDASTPAGASNSNKASASAPAYHEAKTPAGVRGRGDLRSPGVKKTPIAAGGGSTTVNVHDQAAIAAAAAAAAAQNGQSVPVPDFITQTDKYGNATTPRSADAIAGARRQHPTGPEPHIHVTADGKAVDDAGHELHPHEIERRRAREDGGNGSGAAGKEGGGIDVDPCDALLESLRMMCCCLVPEDSSAAAASRALRGATSSHTSPLGPGAGTVTVTRDSAAYYDKNGERTQYSTRESQEQILYEDAAAENQVKLLPAHHPDDLGKKCLVLDLDETLVHSSFRAVPGADFVIPVQIEDVVHFVYVMKRPGVDEFLVEMAKHYEIVVYTASLNKYADPLLDLLDPHKTIRTRLFRESCVYYEGNYVKDLSLLDRDLTQSIIIDNSPSSYIFHPENAIDCTSFIDDPNDRELDQIGAFLKGIRKIDDVRGVSNMWRDWPRLRGVDGVIHEE
jgi:RNA polymerase II subunit A small phosphatase-like protein